MKSILKKIYTNLRKKAIVPYTYSEKYVKLDDVYDEIYKAEKEYNEGFRCVEIRNKAIDEFANALNNSPNIHKWACRDLALEFCNGDDCDECENEFMEEIYQIAEQMKGE